MTSADHYRSKAAEFAAMSKSETSPLMQVEFAKMAAAYLRLAVLAEANRQTDVFYETPTEPNPGSS